ncbi:DNA-3-methyladenine glycosylase family protein [Leuconostoc suionicum]|uniref:DNA-3-methyladenine glycosylase family protein n=1 Tax=Leuconostoc suionicum TaxID=1511761 RepID=UPI0040363CAB
MDKIYTIRLPKLFDWKKLISYLQREPNEIMYHVINNQYVRRAFELDDEIYLIEIQHTTSYLRIVLLNEVHSLKPIIKIIDFIEEWFDINRELMPFYEMAQSDDILAPLIKRFYGLRLVGTPDFFEAISWGIFGQQINLSYAYTLKRRFTEKFGEKITYNGHDYWIYPKPENIAKLTIEELLSIKMTNRKAEYIKNIAGNIAQKNLSKDTLKKYENTSLAEKDMVQYRGLGPWTANYVLMHCLRMGDAFPDTDVGLINGLRAVKKINYNPDKDYLKQLKQRWGCWCGYATFYIWRVIY